MKTIIIGFDGLIRAGKTSLVNKLAHVLDAAIVEEYKSYATKFGTEFPNYPPRSRSEAIKASKFFTDLEKKRVIDLNNHISSKHKIILVDRTSLSCLAFDYSANHFTNLGTFPEVQKLWDKTPKIVPYLNFFMDVSQANIKKRMLINNDNFPPHISEKNFNGHMVDFFKQECKKNMYMIRINANQKPEQVELSVKNTILKYIAAISE